MAEDKLAVAVKHAQSVRNRSAIALREVQQNHARKCEQLQHLQQYKAEYESRLAALGDDGIDARQLQDYRHFLDRLIEAIEQQSGELDGSGENLERAREAWMADYRRSSALERLIDRQQAGERESRRRAEQRQADELNIQRGTDS